MAAVYFLIALFATTAGAMTGMGGGVIIKPLLDLLGGYDTATIGVLSSLTVLIMSLVSVAKQMLKKTEIVLESLCRWLWDRLQGEIWAIKCSAGFCQPFKIQTRLQKTFRPSKMLFSRYSLRWFLSICFIKTELRDFT